MNQRIFLMLHEIRPFVLTQAENLSSKDKMQEVKIPAYNQIEAE